MLIGAIDFVAVLVLTVGFAGCGGDRRAANTPDTPPDSIGHGHGHGHGHAENGFHHSFADVARWSREFDAPDRDAWQKPDEVIRLLDLAPGLTVADVGAGTGYFLPHLSRAVGAGGKVIALDIEPAMVAHMNERVARAGLANVEARKVAADGADLPQLVDRYLIVDTWHHIDARPAYAARLAATLREGGFVVIVDFTKDAPHGPPAAHRLAPDDVVRDLEAGGLRSAIATESLPHQYVVLGRRDRGLPGPPPY